LFAFLSAFLNDTEGYFMVQTWSTWKRFPDAQSGEHVEAPIGPGVYEVRHTMTGRVVAFGHSGNVANALADLKLDDGIGAFTRLFRKQPLVSRVSDLEYRTCAAASRSEARTAAQRLVGLRQTAWRRRMDTGWATRQTH
jgi:hypothetical protein